MAKGRPAARGSKGNGRRLWWLAIVGGLALVVAVAITAGDDGGSAPSAATPSSKGETGPDFHSMVVDPANPQRVFVGGHQRVSVSENGGRTFRPVASLDDADAMGWGFTDGAVYVSGHPGLNVSSDGGRTFARRNSGLPDTDLHAFGSGRAVLYAASPSAGVVASADGGRTWEIRSEPVGGFFGRLVVDPADDQHVLAADAASGVVESTDGGRTWRRLASGLPSATWLSRSSQDLSLLVASGPAGAATSTDGGRTWSSLLPRGAPLIEVSPADPSVLLAGAHDGRAITITASRDGGKTWGRP